ncbi:hypothetical protein [Clostridium sp. HV4-5-A1G]|uniref:hypothetical protein n=1 Tax=Clostridium sp. HV4-5-A1G TaxID=2004595 RepID=UPI00123BB11D|nr:hypothetical protein [Clostridium sp. HV4-5-A1G]KAA8669683.1 hypothetical protein F3O63_13155 [Clostridium sp. HV4-5-A1G]
MKKYLCEKSKLYDEIEKARECLYKSIEENDDKDRILLNSEILDKLIVDYLKVCNKINEKSLG